MAAYILRENNEMTAVDVLDLSYDGCRVETPVDLIVGSKVKLSVGGLGVHGARVRWSQGGKAGLAFTVETSPKREHVSRGSERKELTADLTVRRVGRQHYRLRVFDLSPFGCKVEFVERPKVGELVWVKLESLDAIEAEVCWVEGFFGGIRYLRPIYPAVFDLLIARLTEVKNA